MHSDVRSHDGPEGPSHRHNAALWAELLKDPLRILGVDPALAISVVSCGSARAAMTTQIQGDDLGQRSEPIYERIENLLRQSPAVQEQQSRPIAGRGFVVAAGEDALPVDRGNRCASTVAGAVRQPQRSCGLARVGDCGARRSGSAATTDGRSETQQRSADPEPAPPPGASSYNQCAGRRCAVLHSWQTARTLGHRRRISVPLRLLCC